MKLDTTMRVLVVDDFSTMRAVVMKLLHDLGFTEVEEAADGEQAWQMIQTQPYDLVVCDWNMPKMTGIELLKKLKTHADFYQIRFILITAEAKEHQILDASLAGVDGYIVKPFSEETLYKKIFEVFK